MSRADRAQRERFALERKQAMLDGRVQQAAEMRAAKEAVARRVREAERHRAGAGCEVRAEEEEMRVLREEMKQAWSEEGNAHCKQSMSALRAASQRREQIAKEHAALGRQMKESQEEGKAGAQARRDTAAEQRREAVSRLRREAGPAAMRSARESVVSERREAARAVKEGLEGGLRELEVLRAQWRGEKQQKKAAVSKWLAPEKVHGEPPIPAALRHAPRAHACLLTAPTQVPRATKLARSTWSPRLARQVRALREDEVRRKHALTSEMRAHLLLAEQKCAELKEAERLRKCAVHDALVQSRYMIPKSKKEAPASP